MSDIEILKKYDSGTTEAVLTKDGVLNINCIKNNNIGNASGTGSIVYAMQDYSPQQGVYAPWHEDREYISKVIFADNISYIGSYAFYQCYNIEEVKLPANLTTIGYDAFACKQEDIIPQLNKIVYPNTIATWCGINFNSWNATTKQAFYYTNPVVFGHHFYCKKNAGDIAETLLITIEIPADIHELKPFVFAGFSDITQVNFVRPDNNDPILLEKIGSQAFWGCTSLNMLELPRYNSDNPSNELINVGTLAFDDCYNLKTISIPTNVVLVGTDIFNSCRNLTIYCERQSPGANWSSSWNTSNIPVIWGAKERGLLDNGIYWERSFTDTLDILGYFVESDMRSVEDKSELVIPTSIKLDSQPSADDALPVYSIRDYAFAHSHFTSITLGTESESLDAYITIGTGAFAFCEQLEHLNFNNNIKSLGDYACKGCKKLTTLSFGTNLEFLGEGVLTDCLSLTGFEVATGVSVKMKGSDTRELLAVKEFSQDELASLPFLVWNTTLLQVATGSIPNAANLANLYQIDLRTTSQADFNKVAKYAFKNCKYLGSIDFDFSLDLSAADSMFEDCANLHTVTIRETGTPLVIARNAFKGCAKLNIIHFYGMESDSKGLNAWCNINFINKFSNPLFYDVDNTGCFTKNFYPYAHGQESPWVTFIDGTGTIKLTDILQIPTGTFSIPDINKNESLGFADFTTLQLEFSESVSPIAVAEAAFRNSPIRYINVKTPTATLEDTLYTYFIGRSAFEHTNITQLKLVNSLSESTTNTDLIIEDYAFKNSELQAFTFPNNICKESYSGTFSLGSMVFTKTLSNINVCNNLAVPARCLKLFDLTQLPALTIIEDGTILEPNIFEEAASLTTLTIDFNGRFGRALQKITAKSFSACGELATLAMKNRPATDPYYIAQNCLCLVSTSNINGTESEENQITKVDIIFGANNANMSALNNTFTNAAVRFYIRDFAFSNRTFPDITEAKKLPKGTIGIGKEVFSDNACTHIK